jgi:hypothetical protein
MQLLVGKCLKLERDDIAEDTVGWEDLVRHVVNCRICELAKAL